MTTGKTIALTRWTFVGKVMSLLFNMLSRLTVTFLPRSKHLLIIFPAFSTCISLLLKGLGCLCFSLPGIFLKSLSFHSSRRYHHIRYLTPQAHQLLQSWAELSTGPREISAVSFSWLFCTLTFLFHKLFRIIILNQFSRA